jgi:hypothetical protein
MPAYSLAGYWIGLRQTLTGERAPATVGAGIVSNGASCLVLVYFGASGAWQDWGSLAKLAMWSSVVILALITSGLVVFGGPSLLGYLFASVHQSLKSRR